MATLEVDDLQVHFATEDGLVKAVDGISYSVDRGRTLGIVGESGSGKSVSSLTVMGLTRSARARISGSVRFDGRELLTASDDDLREIRGDDIAMIFQDPLSSLHPFYKVGEQIAEGVRTHRDVRKSQAWDRAVEMLDLVGIPEPRKRAASYPHEFSGGMRQRAMIAMALANDPKLLIADEPTTALDVTVQAQILELIQRLRDEFDAAVVIITHDLGVVAQMADEIAVMYAGRIVEHASAVDLFARARAPLHVGPAALDPDARARARRPARADPRAAAVADPAAGRLLVPPALPLRARGAQARRPDARARRARVRSPGRLPARPRHAAPPVGGAAGRQAARRGARARAARQRASRRAQRRRAHETEGRRMSEETTRTATAAAGPPARAGEPLIEVRDLVKHFPLTSGIIFRKQIGAVRAVDGISFDVLRGETLGVVGESGLRQVDDCAAAGAAPRPDGGVDQVRRHGDRDPEGRGAQGDAARDADDLPGPVRVAEPAQDGRVDHRGAVRHPSRSRPARASASGRCRS